MIILILVLLGLCIGSFVNAFVWRFHEQSRSKKPKKELSILKGRSMCVHCKHSLAVWDLVPLFSWLQLRGKCRYCRKPISWQYPLVELLTALAFVGSYLCWPYGFSATGVVQFGVWLICLSFFMILIVYDLRWMLLPNNIVYPLVGVALVGLVAQVVLRSDASLLLDALWGVVCLFGLFWVLFQVSGGRWIGGGDVKLALALGIIVGGPANALLVVFISSLIGVIVTVPLIIQRKKNYSSRVPFGPFLMVACMVVFLFGQQIVDWYTKLVLGG